VDAKEIETLTRRLRGGESTGGHAVNSREEDERAENRRLRDIRRRVKAARAVVANTPGLAEMLARDWQKTALFYRRHGVTEESLRNGVPFAMRSPPKRNCRDNPELLEESARGDHGNRNPEDLAELHRAGQSGLSLRPFGPVGGESSPLGDWGGSVRPSPARLAPEDTT
jgi:hypothetical protein